MMQARQKGTNNVKDLVTNIDGELLVDVSSSGVSSAAKQDEQTAILNIIASATLPDKETPVMLYRVKAGQSFPGASAGHPILGILVINTVTATFVGDAPLWYNGYTKLPLANADVDTSKLEIIAANSLTATELALMTLAVSSVDIGLKTDSQATDSTSSWSVISVLKGLLRTLLDLKTAYNLSHSLSDFALRTSAVLHGESTAGGGTLVGVKVSPSGAVQVGGKLDVAYGAGNVDAATQRVTLSNDGVGVANIAAIASSQTFSVVTAQSISITASSTQTAAINANTKRIVISPAGNDVWIAIGANPTASIGGAGCLYLADGSQSVPITVSANTKVAVIASVVGGYLNVVEY